MIRKNIFFWPHTIDDKTASFRLRCKTISSKLSIDFNLEVDFGKIIPKDVEILVLSKRYDHNSILHALDLKKRFGTKLVLDICDNHFLLNETYGKNGKSKKDELIFAIRSVDKVITSSKYLAEVIYDQTGKKSEIITDIIEDVEFLGHKKYLKILDYSNFLRLKRRLKKRNCFHFIWFGNHKGSVTEAGMVDLLRIKNELEILAKSHSFTLTILSNSKKMFNSIFNNWTIDVFYMEWSLDFFSEILALHNAVVIPCSLNEFTMSKSDNRVTRSLASHLQVIADPVPSYLPYEEFIFINNWEESLSLCIQNLSVKKRNFDVKNHNQTILMQWFNFLSNNLK